MASDITDVKIFSNTGLNVDSDLLAIQGGDSRYRLNVILSEDGNYEILSNVKGNTLRSHPLPSGGDLRIVGFVEDKENSAGIYFIRSTVDEHCIIRYNSSSNTFTNIIYDEAALEFPSGDNKFIDAGIIGNEDEQSLVWCDGVNPPRMINIERAITGGYTYYNDDVFLFYRKPLISLGASINSTYDILSPRVPNKDLSNKIFQFAIRLLYFDNTFSTLSNYSVVPFPEENIPSGRQSSDIGYDFIEITVDIQNEPLVVDKYQLVYRVVDVGGGVAGTWYIYEEYPFTAKGVKALEFYNDKSIGIISDAEAVRSFDYVPDLAYHVGIIDENRAVFDVGLEGYDNVVLDVSMDVSDSSISANDEGVVQSQQEVVSSGSPESFVLTIGATDDFYIEINFYSVGNENIYFQYTFGLDGIDIGSEIKDYFDGLSIPNLTITDTSTSGEINLLFTVTAGSYIYTSLVLEKSQTFRTLKTGAKYKYGIEYGYNGKRGSVQTDNNLILEVPDVSDIVTLGYSYTNYLLNAELTINHAPPAGATDFRIVSFGSNIDYFEEYLITFNWTDITDSTTNFTMFLEGSYTIIKKDDIINRMRKAYGDETTGIDYGFDFQVGDIIKFIGYFEDAPASDSSFYDVLIQNDLEFRIEVVTSDEIKISSSAIRNVKNLTPSNIWQQWLIQIIRKKETFDSLAQEFSQSYPIGSHSDGITPVTFDVTEFFADVWKSKQVYMNPNNVDEYTPLILSCYAWMEKPKISLYYDSRPLIQGRVNIVNPFAVQRRDNKIRWGGKWIDEAGVNFLTKFDFDDERDLDDRNGVITKIHQIGDVLKVYQERKITSFYLKTTSSIDADGNSTFVFSDAVMSVGRQSIDDYGCTHFSSYVKNVRNAYFFDIINGAVVRDSANGFQEISQNLMHTYFKQKSRDILEAAGTINVFGGWDEDLEMYMITFVNLSNLSDPINETVGFHEPSNRWISFYSFLPEYYGKISGDQLLSFREGELYEHNINETRNNYFGDQFNSEVWLHSTEQAVFNKIYDSLGINSINQWSCPDDDSIIIERPITMQSRLVLGKFRRQEGVYRAEFMRDSLNGGSTSTRDNLVNGRQLRGKEITVKLKNTDITKTLLESVIIKGSISQ